MDIQGVGDLYTDPQIHTEKGTDFGDGNLGNYLCLSLQYKHSWMVYLESTTKS